LFPNVTTGTWYGKNLTRLYDIWGSRGNATENVISNWSLGFQNLGQCDLELSFDLKFYTGMRKCDASDCSDHGFAPYGFAPKCQCACNYTWLGNDCSEKDSAKNVLRISNGAPVFDTATGGTWDVFEVELYANGTKVPNDLFTLRASSQFPGLNFTIVGSYNSSEDFDFGCRASSLIDGDNSTNWCSDPTFYEGFFEGTEYFEFVLNPSVTVDKIRLYQGLYNDTFWVPNALIDYSRLNISHMRVPLTDVGYTEIDLMARAPEE
jgi:hypothetical protein